MNDNPWRVDDMARMERERIQEEMREIRMLEAANRVRPPRPNLPARILLHLSLAVKGWFRHARKPAQSRQPQVRLHAKRHARV